MVVHAILIQSKSIKVKSQVPIQVLLEGEGIEPERSPWKVLPFRHNFSLLQQHPLILALHGHLNERSKLASPLGSCFSSPRFAVLPLFPHQG